MSLVALLALLGYCVCGVMVNEGLQYFYYDSFIQADLDKNDGLLRLTIPGIAYTNDLFDRD